MTLSELLLAGESPVVLFFHFTPRAKYRLDTFIFPTCHFREL